MRFQLGDKKHCLTLGPVTLADAREIGNRIAKLIAHNQYKTGYDANTAEWLDAIGGTELGLRLDEIGLAPGGGFSKYVPTLADWIAEYKRATASYAEATKRVDERAFGSLVAKFGANRPIDSISKFNARAWLDGLRNETTGGELGENTRRKLTRAVKRLFAAAVDHDLIDRNPFEALKTTTLANRARDYTLSPEDSAKILEACPDLQWRLLFAVARWLGVRVPSETNELKWDDVLWDQQRIRVTSPKTKRHAKGERLVPIFADTPLPGLLAEAFDAAPEGAVYVFEGLRRENLRTRFAKIVRRAGLTPWEKLWQNVRAIRETELMATYPIHVTTAWLGNSPAVALKHYLRVTESDFAKATMRVKCASAETSENTHAAEPAPEKPR